ncbi:MAG: 3-deoxy-7-phosphoheptulonate synthase [Clostridiales Family XIII bacterium]|jgi:3-deoxy-7-phosphoheptulonate synthase|nr:3-deoxy-7-phosphoheptulonate synthase [Clostridiales Family XIII bacterium]
MIVVIKDDATEAQIDGFIRNLEDRGVFAKAIKGESKTVFGLVGDVSSLSPEGLARNEFIDKVMKVSEPYKLSSRSFHPDDTVIDLPGGKKIGGGNFAVMAGPCSVESEEQILSIATDVKRSGATMLRGGAFKPRSSPYSFQGLGLDGLDLLKIARQKTGLGIVTEIMSTDYIDVFEKEVDVIQVGARNMQNFTLLKEVGRLGKPVLLKRGPSSTIEELLMAADYVLVGGKAQVILCERGIRTFETATRNTLDLSAVPVLKKRTHLPVVVDPSHGTGYWNLVYPMALAATAAGADGLIIEVHNQPAQALCDGQQSITPQLFDDLMKSLGKIREAISTIEYTL